MRALATCGRAAALLAVAALSMTASFAAERMALVLRPPGMPLHLEHATFFEDGRLVTAVWRNGTREVLYPRLRIFAFDPAGRLAGSQRRCTAEPLQPGTRAQVRMDVQIAGVTARHRFVAVIEEVRSARTIWRVRDPARRLVEAASRAVNAQRTDLTVAEELNEEGALACDCECDVAEALGREGCGRTGLDGFTCTPVFFPTGCSQAFTCRR